MNNRAEAEMTLDLLIEKKRELDRIAGDVSSKEVQFCRDSSNEWVQLYKGIEKLADLLQIGIEKSENENFIHKKFYYKGFEIVQVDEKGDAE